MRFLANPAIRTELAVRIIMEALMAITCVMYWLDPITPWAPWVLTACWVLVDWANSRWAFRKWLAYRFTYMPREVDDDE